MKNITNVFSSFLIVLITLLLVQCKTNNQFDKGSNIENTNIITKKTESFKDYYPSGKLKTKGQLIDNKKTGKWVSYYENGELKSERNYKEGELDGYQKMNYSQVLYMEGHLKKGIKVGTWKSYFKETEQLKYLKHFDDDGNATGEWKNYYDSGELFDIQNYSNNKASGKQIEYFKNGNISSIGDKRNNQKNGIWKYYYDDGTLLCEKEFENDVDNGKYIQYFKNGKVHKTGIKKNFKKVGIWKTYNKQGNLIETVSYEN